MYSKVNQILLLHLALAMNLWELMVNVQCFNAIVLMIAKMVELVKLMDYVLVTMHLQELIVNWVG